MRALIHFHKRSPATEAFLKKLHSIDFKFYKKDYEHVKKLLSDPEIDVNNCDFPYRYSPLKTLFLEKDTEFAKLFLESPRVDWIAPKNDRNLRAVDAEGFEYESDKSLDKPETEAADYFYWLPRRFIRNCAEVVAPIYERIFEEILKIAESKGQQEKTKTALLFKAVEKSQSFEAAQKFCKDLKIRDEQGRTLLHCAHEPPVIRQLLKQGFDLNALDAKEMTPLMRLFQQNQWNGARVLIKSGADTDFMNSKGQTHFTLCPEKLRFLKHFQLSEEHFFDALKHSKSLNWRETKAILEKYPQYKERFEADLLNNLAGVVDWPVAEYAEKFTDDQFLQCLEASMSNCNLKVVARSKYDYRAKHLFPRPDLIEKNAAKLLVAACKAGRDDVMIGLLIDYFFELDPLKLVEGKTLLFNAKEEEGILYLLQRRVNPQFKHDDLLFFERDDFMKGVKCINGKWLLELIERGFDLFNRSTKTGKSLIDYFEPEAVIFFDLEHFRFKFPVTKLTKTALNRILKNEAIDDDGNYAYHYGTVYGFKGKFPSIAALKKACNFAGKSAYQLMLETDKHFYLGRRLHGEDFAEYLNDYIALHGRGWIKEFGGRLLLKALIGERRGGRDHKGTPKMELARFLLEDGKVSLDRFIGKESIGERVLRSRDIGDDSFCLLFEFGLEKNYAAFDRIIKNGCSRALRIYLDSCSDKEIVDLIHRVIDKTSFRSGDWDFPSCPEEFFEHERVRNAVHEEDGKQCKLLEKLYFRLCNNESTIELFEKLGISARTLDGTGIEPKSPTSEMKYFWEALKRHGWTVDDFAKYSWFSRISRVGFELAYNGHCTDSHDDLYVYASCSYEALCSICDKPMYSDMKCTIICCQHMFHAECHEKYFAENEKCPMCLKRETDPTRSYLEKY